MSTNELDQDVVSYLNNLFKKKKPICVGDKGIYQDVLTVDTINDGTHSLKYDIFIKISAKAVYENLIEIEVIDTFTLNTSNTDVQSLIKANIPKYIKPKYIKWEVK
jgi:hypothetical protein